MRVCVCVHACLCQYVVCGLTLTLQVHSHADLICKLSTDTNEVLLCSASVSVRNVVGC